MEEKIYAPIIIVTLNRVKHLKKCIQSLSRNAGAENTEIYISVDYPPNEKYEAGHLEVVEYLKTAKELSIFKKVHIFYQKKNLGVSDNIEFVKNIVKKTYETYIFTEDDNEFSVNFLDYVNKGLEKYNKSKFILAINGMSDTKWYEMNNNVTGSKLFPAYGFGTWFKKEEIFKKELQQTLMDSNTWKLKTIIKFFKRNKFTCSQYISGVVCSDEGLFYEKDGMISMCDSTRTMYMYLSDYICVVPMICKSRTWGNDGSGVNMPKNVNIDPLKMWPLDDKKFFEYKNDVIYHKENDKIAEKYLTGIYGKKMIIEAVIQYIILFICGYDRQKVIYLKKKMRCFKRIVRDKKI